MNALLIYNPAAGQKRHDLLPERVRIALPEYQIDEFKTTQPGDACRAAAEAASRPGQYHALLAAGGDGTINETVTGMLRSGNHCSLPLGLIPAGTKNVLARHLGIPAADFSKQIAIIREGFTRTIDVGRMGSQCFTLVAGFGFDGAVVSSVALPIKEAFGPAAYALAALGTLANYHSTRFRLTLDGRKLEVDAYLVLAANIPSYAMLRMQPASFASIDDGWLDICVFERNKSNKMGFISQIASVVTRRHLRNPRMRYYRARSIAIESDPPALVQLDGDLAGSTPVSVEILPRAIRLLVPSDPSA